ncbi:hypothetical protein DFH29DRAFT_1007223 [Suillus ampliporus]|nr:hypothetical protein DFH29DRAFT_1007223 [Suillus ampliporus]
MSKKLQTAVLYAIIAGKDWIFDDVETMKEIYGLDQHMFAVPNTHLTDEERNALQGLIEGVKKADGIKLKYQVLEGQKGSEWDEGRDALTKWFQKQRVSPVLSERIDAVWDELEMSPMHLIQDPPIATFPEIQDADGAKEDIVLAIFGQNALARGLRGDFREACGTVVHHSWERHRKRYIRAKKSISYKSIAAQSFCQIIEEADIITPRMVLNASSAVKAYRDAISWFPLEKEMVGGVAEYEEFLKDVVVTAVAKAKRVPREKLVEESPDCPAKTRARKRSVKVNNKFSLAAAGPSEQIWAVYVQLFQVVPPQPEALRVTIGEESGQDAWVGV